MIAPTILILAAGRGDRFRAAGGLRHKLAAPRLLIEEWWLEASIL